MKATTDKEVADACRTLFGKDIDISREFLYNYVQPNGVKAAYRKKAKENHPDLFAGRPADVQQKQTALFREILDAYDVLTRFFQQRELRRRAAAFKRPQQRARKKEAPQPKSSSPHSSAFTNGNVYYKGKVPQRVLQIGHYLYFRGKITYAALIKALIWQRKQRPSIGTTAVQWGWLDSEKVDTVFKVCGKTRLFGEKAIELGLLTNFQVNTILLYQRSQQVPLGNYFIHNAILTQQELDSLVRELKEHNDRTVAQVGRTKGKRVIFS